ncbi:hypothetical protein DNTS_025376 [Danionella cerebrum]|uniref:Immunoglobulin subtype domain-containing protein n=1 Tax=Danionella cerebrum TaxID=2873325 RepID=A0A553RME7_9TELE|nr:hypothetical protein DNTS_025376 [Danionella translucida]
MNCDLEENEVFWIVLKSPDPPTQILGSFTSVEESPYYFNKSFRRKYSVQFKHRLVINNISADELGVYFCMSTRCPPKFSNSSRIYLNITDTSRLCSAHNETSLEFTDHIETQWNIIFIISPLMITSVLIIFLIIFAAEKSERCGNQTQNSDLQTQVLYQNPTQIKQ